MGRLEERKRTIRMIIAYIDPGTGAVMLQMLIAALVGIGVFFRQRIKSLLTRKPASRHSNETHEDGH